MVDVAFTTGYPNYPLNTSPVSTPFTFVPKPRMVSKVIKLEWRARHTGRARYMKARQRSRFHESYKLEGILDDDMRHKLEYYAGSPMAFLFTCDMTSPIGYDEDNTYPSSNDNVYVIVDQLEFRQVEHSENEAGKIFYHYVLTLKRVKDP